MSSGAAIVTTLRNADAVVDSFIAYHRAIGFDHIYLIFDDPADPALPRAAATPGVTALAHDERLRESWQTLPSYTAHGAFVDSEVMSRQILNVEFAAELARRADYLWLLSIDIDELFFAIDSDVAAHFGQLSRSTTETVVYPNFEAVPECDAVADYFREVTLFKAPMAESKLELAYSQLPHIPAQICQPYFHFYSNGKSAFRLESAGLAPHGVHAFGRENPPVVRAQSSRHFILHYACCGFDAFWTKYVTLGRFENNWWGSHPIADIIPFHLEARDAVAAGKDAAIEFYRSRIAMSAPADIEMLIEARMFGRIEEPARILKRLMPR